MPIKHFEDLEVWKEARRLTRQVYQLTEGSGVLSKAKRDARIVQAVHRYGYSQREIADFLGLHYATVSRLASRP